MKFKIGDRVKIISKKNGDQYTTYGFKIGDICRIAKIDNNRLAIYKDKGDYFGFIFKYNVELAQENQFTKADLKHGDKCTLKNGQVIFFDKTSNYSFDSIDEQLRYFNDDVSIAKVERPIKYETVFEREEVVLDETEKRYLSGVIRPFKDKVKYIQKWTYSTGVKEIKIATSKTITRLPGFTNDMYKGMKENKKYTLKELGL